MHSFDSVLDRHHKIALQFSGGRDSLACLYLMRPFWDRMTVYWGNTGAAYPETLAIVAQVKAMVPHFVEVQGHQPEVIAQFGLPSDIVPASHTPIGLIGSGRTGPLIQDRYSCCFRTIVIPMQQRMIADGVTLVIRGQKNADRLKWSTRSGDVQDGVEYLFPVEDWSHQQVTDYLREQSAPVSPVYEILSGTPDCLTCSAYWEEGAAKYLRQHHPDAHAEVQRRLDIINEAIAPSIAAFNDEVNEWA